MVRPALTPRAFIVHVERRQAVVLAAGEASQEPSQASTRNRAGSAARWTDRSMNAAITSM